jgi:hypothetical protein
VEARIDAATPAGIVEVSGHRHARTNFIRDSLREGGIAKVASLFGCGLNETGFGAQTIGCVRSCHGASRTSAGEEHDPHESRCAHDFMSPECVVYK